MITIAFDDTPDSLAALDWAAAEARRRQCPLNIVYALAVPTVVGGPVGPVGVIPDEVVAASHALLMSAASQAYAVGVDDVRVDTAFGSPAAVLTEASTKADLLVLGTRGRGEFRAALLGSVAFTVSAHASCPVVVVRGDGRRAIDSTHAVVVGVDGSEAAHRAVSFAADLAARAEAELRLVGAWTLPSDVFVQDYWVATGDPKIVEAHRIACREAVDEARAQVRAEHPELSVTTLISEGDPAQTLAEAGREAGLVVVGSRGRGGFSGLLLGSVSHRVIHTATCPVAVVR